MARGKKKAAVDTGPVKGPWDLPDGWRWERLDIAAPVNPKRQLVGLDDTDAVAFVPMAAVSEMGGGIDTSQRRQVGTVKAGFTRFYSGDVILAKITPCMENGKLAIIPDIPHGKGAGSTEFHVLEPKQLERRLLFYWLHRQSFRQDAEHNMTGTAGQKRVPTVWLRDQPIPIPPPQLQPQIVARIDALFAEIDAGEAALADARNGVETYCQSLLKAAVTGELTADWRQANPPQETGEQLLARILADRRARWHADPKNARKKYTEPAAPDTGLPELPEGWAWSSFDMLFETMSDGGLKTQEKEYLPQGMFPIIDQGAKSIAGYSNNPNMIQPHQLPVILFGDHTRRFKLVDFPFCIGADGIKIMSPHRLMNVDFLLSSLLAAHFEDRGYSRHYQFVRALNFAVPPLPEQDFIASLVTDAMSAAKGTLLDISRTDDTASTLRQSIVAAAFRGELTA